MLKAEREEEKVRQVYREYAELLRQNYDAEQLALSQSESGSGAPPDGGPDAATSAEGSGGPTPSAAQ